MGKLKERMQNELRIRGYSDRTVILYLNHMKRFVQHFKKSPDLLGPEEIYQYQCHLVKQDVSWCTFNQSVCSLRFFYNRVLYGTSKNWLIEHVAADAAIAILPAYGLLLE
jgi:site-specific recombinase XerD